MTAPDHNPGASDLERRLLLVTPTARDERTTLALLTRQQIPATPCASADDLLAELQRGAAAIVIPEELVHARATNERLCALLEQQPAWSDLPVLVLAHSGASSAASGEAVRTLGNVTLLERPVQVNTLVSAIRTALRARTRQLQIRDLLAQQARAEQSLRLADQRKDEFLATLGHELRNPLAPLVTGLQLLKSPRTRAPCLQEVTVVMDRQLQHLVRLVDDLLEVSRITRGLVNIQHEALDLVYAVRTAIDATQPLLEAQGHTLVTDLPEYPVAVSGDAVRLTQVFSNLLTNAAKYTNAGGTIWLTVRHSGDHVLVSVRDNGIGIPPAQLDSVFDMFMQVDRSSRRAQGGLGIGLTLVRSLVALHGGQVRASSAGPGTGSQFVVELPALIRSTPDDVQPQALSGLPSRRLLIVDDNRDAADTLALLLDSLGVTVEVARGGQQALDAVPRFRPDVVLLDIGMPGMDGYAVARRIRALPGPCSPTLIALTGWGQEQDVRRAREAGFDHHLIKPVDFEKLRKLLAPTGTAYRAPVGSCAS